MNPMKDVGVAFLYGYDFKWQIAYLTPNDLIVREYLSLLYQGFPPLQ